MQDKELLKKIAKLETINDQLAAEINQLQQITHALGFAEGVKTLKAAALEMIAAEEKRKRKPSKKGDGATPPPSN